MHLSRFEVSDFAFLILLTSRLALFWRHRAVPCRDESGRKRSRKYSNHFRFHIFMRERVRERETSVGKTKSNTRENEIEIIRSEACL